MEKKTFRTMSFGQKVEHIWEYYRWLVLGSIAAVILLVYIIVQAVTPKPDILLNVTLLNANSLGVAEPDVFVRYLEEKGYDPQTEEVYVNTTMHLEYGSGNSNVYQALAAMVLVGEIDLLVGDENSVGMIAAGNGLMPLTEFLEEELTGDYADEDLFFWTDETTGKSEVCGIWLPEGNPLAADGYYKGRALATIPYTAQNQDMAKEMLVYLIEGGSSR